MSLLYRFNNIFNKNFSLFEVLLNLSFILIICVIIYIVYWTLLNRKIANINRCKINLNSIGNYYNISSLYNNKKMYSINYETGDKHNVSVNCSCPSGTIANTFKIPLYNHNTEKMQIIDKYCLCDDFYTLNSKDNKNKITYSGDEFLTNYYKDNYDKELETLRNPNKIIDFPQPL